MTIKRKGGTFTKRGAGFIKPPKHPFSTMEIGQSVSITVKDEKEERRLRNASAATCVRKGYAIRGRKIADDVITFTKIR